MTAIYLVAAVLFSAAGYKQMEKKNRDPWLGAVLGFFLGLIGLIIVLSLSERKNPIAQGPGGPVGPATYPPSGPAFPTGQAAPVSAAASAQSYVAPSGQRYVAPIVTQYAAPQPPPAPPQT